MYLHIDHQVHTEFVCPSITISDPPIHPPVHCPTADLLETLVTEEKGPSKGRWSSQKSGTADTGCMAIPGSATLAI
jgi:hypothetical protein